MARNSLMLFKQSPTLRWYIVLLCITVILSLTLPTQPATLSKLHITQEEYRVAILSFIVPYAVIWFSAFYGYQRLQRYAKSIRKSREGDAFQKIANGIRILAWGLVIPTLLAVVLGGIDTWRPAFHPFHVIIDNYVTLLVAILSYSAISSGTRELLATVRLHSTLSAFRLSVLAYVTLGVMFTYFVVHNYHSYGNPYFLSLPILIATIIIPYLYIWFIGLTGVYEIYLYSTKVKGVLYKQALSWLQLGIIIVIAGSVLSQYLTSALPTNGSLTFNLLLLLVYLLLIVEAVGYVCIAYGSRRLTHIEEV